MKHAERFFKYTGELRLTRGDYGARVTGGHECYDRPGGICTADPDFGEMFVTSIQAGLESGDWIEVTEQEWREARRMGFLPRPRD
jgi:hypothetical protein